MVQNLHSKIVPIFSLFGKSRFSRAPMTQCGILQKFTFALFWQNIRESNKLTNEVTKYLVGFTKFFFSARVKFLFFHTLNNILPKSFIFHVCPKHFLVWTMNWRIFLKKTSTHTRAWPPVSDWLLAFMFKIQGVSTESCKFKYC